VVEDRRNPTKKEMGYLYFPPDFWGTTELVLKFLQNVVGIHAPNTNVRVDGVNRLTVQFKNGFPFVGEHGPRNPR